MSVRHVNIFLKIKFTAIVQLFLNQNQYIRYVQSYILSWLVLSILLSFLNSNQMPLFTCILLFPVILRHFCDKSFFSV